MSTKLNCSRLLKNSYYFLILTVFTFTSCQKGHPGFPGPIKNDSRLIVDWIGLQLQVIRNTTGVTHIAYSRHFSYTGVALYESLVKGEQKYNSIASSLNGEVHIDGSLKSHSIFYPAAANAAIAEMMRFFYGANAQSVASIDSLEHSYFSRFMKWDKKFDMNASVGFGKQVAAKVIAWSKLDGSDQANIPYTLLGEGYWEPTPAALAPANMPGWQYNKTMLPQSIDGTIPGAPISFSKDPGTDFHTMVKEVYDVSQSLTYDQRATALFWDDAPNGKYVTVFGHWFSILKQVLEKEKPQLMQGADAYLRLGITLNETVISCWTAKYKYNLVRPITYIRKYMGYPEWNSLISTPPHPEYSAAHATLSASAGYALESVFGKNYSFVDHTYDGIGMSPRSFASFEAAGREAGLSRLYGGIHYRPSIETGNVQGKKVGANVFSLLHTH